MLKRSAVSAWTGAAALLALVVSSHAHAAEIKVMAANALKPALAELAARFEHSSDHKVVVVWGGTEGIAKRVVDGDPTHVVIIAAPNIDNLIARGKLAAGSRADIARSGVGIAVPAGLPKPDISTPEAVRNACLPRDRSRTRQARAGSMSPTC